MGFLKFLKKSFHIKILGRFCLQLLILHYLIINKMLGRFRKRLEIVTKEWIIKKFKELFFYFYIWACHKNYKNYQKIKKKRIHYD